MALEKLVKTPALLRKIGQVGDTRPFYSPVDKAISEITQNKATGEQMLAALLKTKGVAKELKDRPAIKKALEQPKITKQELERVAAEHPPAQIEESRSSGTFNQLEPTLPKDGSLGLVKDPPSFSGNRYPYGVRDTKTGDIIGYGWDKGDAILDVYSGYPRYWGKHAQYEQYTTPGGENYREILLKLPSRRPSLKNMSRDEYNKAIEKADLEGVEDYRASHFEGEPNILAHARVADRTGPNGEKILHVEEIQSDWHQKARDVRNKEIKRLMQSEGIDKATASKRVPESFGYAQSATQRIKGVVQPDEYGGYKVVWEDGTFSGGYSKESAEAKALEGKSNATSGVVPDAPFKQNWHELVMKRLLDDAARNGYDKVVITPGTEQAKRYALSNVIDEINVVGRTHALTGERTKQVALDTKDGRSLRLGIANDGTIDNVSDSAIEGFLGKKLDEVVGKDVAKNIMEGGSQTISGEGLQVGGEGMKGFYDQILTSFLNNYGKPYGSRVGTHNLVVPPKNSMDVQGYPLGEEYIQGQKTWSEFLAANPRAAEEFYMPVHSFDITPQMREDIIGKGLPLYQVAPVGIGAGAAMQGEQPEGYGAGGVVKKAAKAVSAFKGQQAVLPAAESAANLERFLADSAIKDRLYHGTAHYANTPEKTDKLTTSGIKSFKKKTRGTFLSPDADLADYTNTLGGPQGAVYPVYAQVKDPFDYENSAHLDALAKQTKLSPEGVRHLLFRDTDNWQSLEEPYMQKAIKQLGHDGYYTLEEGRKNLSVYDPRQIKSAIGNRGTYDITDPDITKADGGIVSRDEGEQLFRKRAQDLPSLMDSHERHKLQDLLQRTRIQGSGGKDQYGTGAGGRVTHTVPLGNGMFVSPYIEGNLYKPVGQPAMGGVTGAGLNIGKTWKNGGSVSGDAMFMAVMNKNLKGKKNA